MTNNNFDLWDYLDTHIISPEKIGVNYDRPEVLKKDIDTINKKINNITNLAPEDLDSLKEVSDAITNIKDTKQDKLTEEQLNNINEPQDISGKANIGDSYTKLESDAKYLLSSEFQFSPKDVILTKKVKISDMTFSIGNLDGNGNIDSYQNVISDFVEIPDNVSSNSLLTVQTTYNFKICLYNSNHEFLKIIDRNSGGDYQSSEDISNSKYFKICVWDKPSIETVQTLTFEWTFNYNYTLSTVSEALNYLLSKE